MFKILKPLTYKSRIRQIGDNNKFILQDNEVFSTTEGIVIAPRLLYTDNITFINNTFVDIRASHVHDVGCATHKLIVSRLTEQNLIDMDILHFNEKATNRERENLRTLKKQGKYDGSTEVLVFVCEDIPKNYLDIIDVNFSDNNILFKQMLQASGVSDFKSNIMGASVFLNAGWLLKKNKPMLPIDKIFKEILVT